MMSKVLDLELMDLEYTPIDEVFPDHEPVDYASIPQEFFTQHAPTQLESSAQPAPTPQQASTSTKESVTMSICTGKQRMTLQKLRQQLGLPLLSKQKLDTMSTALCSQLITDYIMLTRKGL